MMKKMLNLILLSVVLMVSSCQDDDVVDPESMIVPVEEDITSGREKSSITRGTNGYEPKKTTQSAGPKFKIRDLDWRLVKSNEWMNTVAYQVTITNISTFLHKYRVEIAFKDKDNFKIAGDTTYETVFPGKSRVVSETCFIRPNVYKEIVKAGVIVNSIRHSRVTKKPVAPVVSVVPVLSPVIKPKPATQSTRPVNPRVRVSPDQKKKGKITSLPFIGNETPLTKLEADTQDYVGKPFILIGGVEIQDYYNYEYSEAKKTHISLRFTELRADMSPTGKILNLYVRRSISKGLVDKLTEVVNKGYTAKLIRVGAGIVPSRYGDGSTGDAELLNWQFLSPDRKSWLPWALAEKSSPPKYSVDTNINTEIAIDKERELVEAKNRRMEAEKIRKIVNDRIQKALEKKIKEDEARKKKYKQEEPKRLLKMSKMLMDSDAFKALNSNTSAAVKKNLHIILKEYLDSPEAKEAKVLLKEIEDEM